MRKLFCVLFFVLLGILTGCEEVKEDTPSQSTSITTYCYADRRSWSVSLNITITATSRSEALSKISKILEAESENRKTPVIQPEKGEEKWEKK